MMFDQLALPSTSRLQCSLSTRNSESLSIEAMRRQYFFKLESETSSLASETESVYSVQGYETERVQDTPDTDSKSESSCSDVDLEVEYEVEDLLPEEENPFVDGVSSTDAEEVLAAAGAIAAAICDSSLEKWLTDGEDSSDSVSSEITHTDFWTCTMCKTPNNNPRFRYCYKCYQMRKNLFPPRPRGHRKRKDKQPSTGIKMSIRRKSSEIEPQVSASSQPTVSSHDSGISSQDVLDAGCSTRSLKRKSDENDPEEDTKRLKVSPISHLTSQSPRDDPPNCWLCETRRRNSVFVHGSTGCMLSCYVCAMKSWATNKKCPFCTRKANNVIRIFKCD